MTHLHEIQTSLDYIETHVHDELNLDEISKVAGFSKFYFHRTFKREVGISIYEYIRKRRLTLAASDLLNTNIPILEIAINYQFESQESFTRAFKSIYQLPPGRYRTVIKDLILGGSNMSEKNEIKGWIVTGTAPEKYHLRLDDKIFHMGSKAAHIQSIADDYTPEEYGTIMQQVSARSYVGKRMRFSGFIKSKNVEGWCGLWMRIDNGSGTTLKLDNMQTRPITGSTEWNYYSCVLDIPESAAIINAGALLIGKGQVWFDNADFQEVDQHTPTTEFIAEQAYPDHFLNQSFEETDL